MAGYRSRCLCVAMAELVPTIHVFAAAGQEGVDAWVKPGMTAGECAYSAARLAAFVNFFSTRSRFSFDR